MNFIDSVNRVLVNNFILKGDDDFIISFTGNQHEATTRLAINSITSELNNFTSFFSIGYERVEGTLTTVQGQRTYQMPTDFVRFWGDNPYLQITPATSSDNFRLYEVDEDRLRSNDYLYKETEGREISWYWTQALTKSLSLYNIPDGVRVYNYDYERDVSVSNTTDIMPFQTESEAQAFTDMASRRFKYMLEELNVSDLEQDADYIFQRQTLMNLLRHRNPNKKYGKRYS